MIDSVARPDLGGVSRALRDNPTFLAGRLGAAYADDELADRLRLDPKTLHRLLVCRAPRPDRFTADVTAVAQFMGIPAQALAGVVREADTLQVFVDGPAEDPSAQTSTGMLAAARDTAAEAMPIVVGNARIRELADGTWDMAPEEARRNRDVEAALLWAAPVIVVSLAPLSLDAANRWLTERGLPHHLAGGNGPLRGLLLAWRGRGIVFVDESLEAAERRFTVAHEHGHFLLDYLEPRRRIAEEAPDLLDVVDRRRPSTAADRARAALIRLPLDVYTHLLDRDAEGGVASGVAAAEDDASIYAQELLAPWSRTLELARDVISTGLAYEETVATAAGAIADEFTVPAEPARARATAALDHLGRRRGFFEG